LTHAAEAAVAQDCQQRVNVTFTGEVETSFHMTMWRRHALRVPSNDQRQRLVNIHINEINAPTAPVQHTTHTHPFKGPLSGTTRVSRYQKGKTNLGFTEARDSEWQWHQLGHMQVCTSLQTGNHASTPPLSFLQAGCPSCCLTNSVKALKATVQHTNAQLKPTYSRSVFMDIFSVFRVRTSTIHSVQCLSTYNTQIINYFTLHATSNFIR